MSSAERTVERERDRDAPEHSDYEAVMTRMARRRERARALMRRGPAAA